MRFMSKFAERLSELMLEHGLTNEKLAHGLNVDDGTVGCWRKNKHNISLHNALKVADYFKCSLEFLVGRAKVELDFKLLPHRPFYERLRQIMAERNITWYRIVKDGIVSDCNLSVWKNGTEPYLETVIDIADYFKLTLDQLVGRED